MFQPIECPHPWKEAPEQVRVVLDIQSGYLEGILRGIHVGEMKSTLLDDYLRRTGVLR